MYIDVIFDAEDEDIEAFLDRFVDIKSISKKRGFATISIALRSVREDEIFQIINSPLMEFVLRTYPDLSIEVMAQPPRSENSAASFSLMELIKAFNGDLSLLFEALRFVTLRAGKLRFRKDLADKCIRKLFLDPEINYKRILELLDKFYPKVVSLLSEGIKSGFVPMKNAWDISYLFAYEGKGFVQKIAKDNLEMLIKYAQSIDAMDRILPSILAYKFNSKAVKSDLMPDVTGELYGLLKRDEGLDLLSTIVYFQLIFGSKVAVLDFAASLKVDLKEILEKLITVEKLSNKHIALFSLLTIFFGCDLLFDFLGEKGVERFMEYGYWHCFKRKPQDVLLFLELGSINPFIFKEVVSGRRSNYIEKYLMNHLDWATVVGETQHGKRDYGKFIAESILESRDQINVEVANIDDKSLILKAMSNLVGLSDSGDMEISYILNLLFEEKEIAKSVARFVLLDEWERRVSGMEGGLGFVLVEYLDKIDYNHRVNFITGISELEDLKKTWAYFTSSVIPAFASEITSPEAIKPHINNRGVQEIFFKSIQDLLNYLQIEGGSIYFIPEESPIRVRVGLEGDDLIARIEILEGKEVQYVLKASKIDASKDMDWFRRMILEKLLNVLESSVHKLKERAKDVREGAKFMVLSPSKIDDPSKINLGIETRVRVILCGDRGCLEKLPDDLDRGKLIYESDELFKCIEEIERGVRLAKKFCL